MRAALQFVIHVSSLVVLLSSIPGCATTVSIRVEDPGDVSRFRTWDWLRDVGESPDAPVDPNAELELQVAHQIERSLSARGFRRAPGRADVLIAFDLGIRREVVEVAQTGALETLNSLHSSPSFEVQATRYEMRHYEIADLKIIAIDPRERNVVWRGSFAKRYAKARSPQVRGAVVELLAQLPTPRPPLDAPRAIVREHPMGAEPPS